MSEEGQKTVQLFVLKEEGQKTVQLFVLVLFCIHFRAKTSAVNPNAVVQNIARVKTLVTAQLYMDTYV